jgi:hypothetical protein
MRALSDALSDLSEEGGGRGLTAQGVFRVLLANRDLRGGSPEECSSFLREFE